MPDRRQRVWLAMGAALLLTVLLIMAPPGRRVPLDQRLTTLRTSPDGAGALYELLVELEIPVDRRMTPLDGPTPVNDALALLAPTEALSPTEQDSVVGWLERGGTLIIAPGHGDPMLERLGLVRKSRRGSEAWARPVDHRLTRGVDSVGTVGFTVAVEDSTALTAIEPLVVLGDAGRLVAMNARFGHGTVILVSDPSLLSNGRIHESGIAPIIARAAADAGERGSPLVFDEYHHGHRGGTPSQAFFGFLFGSPTGWLLLQLLVVAGLAALPAAVRFGAPVPAAATPRRSPLEHVAALGEVYRQARAEDVARRRLMVGFSRRLGRERPPPGGEPAFLARLINGVPVGADAVAEVSRAWEQKLPVRELAERIDNALERLNRTA